MYVKKNFQNSFENKNMQCKIKSLIPKASIYIPKPFEKHEINENLIRQ